MHSPLVVLGFWGLGFWGLGLGVWGLGFHFSLFQDQNPITCYIGRYMLASVKLAHLWGEREARVDRSAGELKVFGPKGTARGSQRTWRTNLPQRVRERSLYPGALLMANLNLTRVPSRQAVEPWRSPLIGPPAHRATYVPELLTTCVKDTQKEQKQILQTSGSSRAPTSPSRLKRHNLFATSKTLETVTDVVMLTSVMTRA